MTLNDNELDRLLEEKLKLIQPTPPRNPDIARHQRDAYLKQVRYLQFGKPVFALAGLLNRKPWKSLFRQPPALLPFAAAILLIFGLVFASWGTVYAAQDSLPNDLLYSVKLSGENLQLAFTPDTEAKISLLTTYSGRRVQEAITLTLQGQPIPEDLSILVDEKLDELFALAASLDEASSQEALKGIQIHLRDQDKDMTNAMNGIPGDLDPLLTQLRETVNAHRQLASAEPFEPPYPFKLQLRNQQTKLTTIPITTTLTSTITTTLNTTPDITPSGHYGPGGHCDDEAVDCGAPFGYMDPFGPFEGTPPDFESFRGYSPGSDEGEGPLQPSETPKVGEPKQPPDPNGGYDSGKDKGDSDTKKGNP